MLLFSAAVHAGEHGRAPDHGFIPADGEHGASPLRSVPVETRCSCKYEARFPLPRSLLHPPSTELVILPYCCFFSFAAKLMEVLLVKGLETGSSSGRFFEKFQVLVICKGFQPS